MQSKQHLFAVLDDDSVPIRLSIICLRERQYNGSFSHTLEGLPRTNEDPYSLRWATARDTDTNLQELTLVNEKIFLWRTPWAVSYKNVWLPVLDSNKRGRLPVSFDYVGEGHAQRILEQKMLRTRMISEFRLPYPPPVSSPPSPEPRIPSFVANIMKQDAIRNKADCPISMESITESTNTSLTSCYHIFETESLNTWMNCNRSCPVCKVPVSFTVKCQG
jgi:hypothetical protein